ncbi:unnamed protein product, partial [Schistosoma curassoni]|uniref:Fibronectin type-III domain-containing protein n=1 Tax=Schistosoma curassoni TaxID=6186 RepID=A0A183JE33_9TREM
MTHDLQKYYISTNHIHRLRLPNNDSDGRTHHFPRCATLRTQIIILGSKSRRYLLGLIYLCLSGLFVMSDLSCNADVTDSFNITQNTPIPNSNCTLLNDVIVENHNDCDPCTQGPSVKKPRLFEQQDTVCKLNNGFKDGYNICNLKSLPEIQEELKKVRLCFDSKLKLALKEKLSKYISFIETTEKTVTSLKEEITQLTGRMDFIESSSKDLTKLINERIPLPAPTSGIGQSRTLSSQAPRLPVLSHSPSVSAPDRSIQTVNPSNRQPNLTSSNSVSSRLLSVLPKTFELQCVPPQTASGTVLAIQVNDTIDLTSDTNIENAWEEHLVSGSTNTKKINKHSATPLSNLQNGIISTINVPPSFTFDTGNSLDNGNSKQSYLDLASLSQAQNITTNQITNSLPYSVIPDVQLLPVALLPPVPTQPVTNINHLPLQPVPQLTIAEAAEGVCLQWSITYPIGSFEPAISYEIYSYASSEVNLVTVQTSLPWKK